MARSASGTGSGVLQGSRTSSRPCGGRRRISSPLSASSSAGRPASIQCSSRPIASTSRWAASRCAGRSSTSTAGARRGLLGRRQRHLQAHQLHAALIAEQQHEGLQVAVRHAAVVGEGQAAQHLRAQRGRLLRTEGTASQTLGQRLGRARVVQHVGPVFAHTDLTRLGQVRVLQTRRASHRLLPALQGRGIGGLHAGQQQQAFALVASRTRWSRTRQAMQRWLLPTRASSSKRPRRRASAAPAAAAWAGGEVSGMVTCKTGQGPLRLERPTRAGDGRNCAAILPLFGADGYAPRGADPPASVVSKSLVLRRRAAAGFGDPSP